MSLLTDADVDAMRGVLDDSLPDTAVIKTSTYVSDGGGGGTNAWVAAGTVACRIVAIPSAGEDEGEYGSRISADATWLITLPAATTINRNAEVTIGATTYRVEAIRAPRSWELSRRVEAVEVV